MHRTTLLSVGVLLLPGAALAADDDYGRRTQFPTSPLVTAANDRATGYGAAIMAGGGTMNRVTPDGARDNATFTGGSWLLRAVAGTRSIVAGEVAYLGSAVPVDAQSTGASSDSTLISNGGQVDLRLQAPIPVGQTSDLAVAPFALAGFAVLGHGVAGDGIDDGTNLGERLTAHIPVGAGLAVMGSGFIADARFSYRPVVGGDEPLFATGTAFDGAMNGIAVTGSVGVEF